jgi:chemotaxis protein methyltransferase CheR
MAAISPETGPAAKRSDISEENYGFLQKYIYQEFGNFIDTSRHYLLEARLTPLTRREQLKTLNNLCALLRAAGPAPIKREVIEAMTTNETLFFRDRAPFGAQDPDVPALQPHLQEQPLQPDGGARQSGALSAD